ncbi:MAG TPA: hypothetical protein VFB67_02945 [Candidatus Polarisedimenticolaceae bacterium]|nr:hypothetical protein [Candidatus Polarisedimenticolaceae bacterium]
MRRSAVVGPIVLALLAPAARADDTAAERQLRIAQRLAADRSPDAAAAFQQVVTLAPRGRLADDALAGLARFNGAPDWPEELGRLDPRTAAAATTPLERILAEYPGGDHAAEARYRLALIRSAPLPGRDAARARKELIDAANGPRDTWTARARYALGVLDERTGESERAAGEYARVLVDQPESDAAARARAGFGRTRLAKGRFGEAAAWFQAAVEAGVPGEVRAEASRELALAALVRERAPALKWSALTTIPASATARGAALIAASPDGAMATYDRKTGTIQITDASGASLPARPVEDVSAIAFDPYGRLFVATKDKLLRADGPNPAPVGTLGAFAAPTGMAVDASGGVWLIDRRGDRVGRWMPGATEPSVVREEKGSGATALVAAGGGVVVAEGKSGRLVAIGGSGSVVPLGSAVFRRPAALSVDAAGRIAVLDEKEETLTRLSASGEVLEVLALPAVGVSHPVALAAAPDGGVRILDGSSGSIAVAP